MHTFITSWGEFTPTLNGMLQLTHLLLFGESNAICEDEGPNNGNDRLVAIGKSTYAL